ncbi:unnamed protein product [Somion occarium]|uniref:Uncharacterized protein n=1 Tax=Somion occarium TaxID=3059160 RepID=A0ABP1DHT6_9APHY
MPPPPKHDVRAKYNPINYASTPSPTTSRRQRHPRAALSLARRGMTAEDIPYPPPPYTPTVALHAATLAPGEKDPSIVSWPAEHAATNSHTGPLVGAILAVTVIVITAAAVLVVLVKSKRLRLPCFTSRTSRLRAMHLSSRRARGTKMAKRSTSVEEKAPLEDKINLYARVSQVPDYFDEDNAKPLSENAPTRHPIARRSHEMFVNSSADEKQLRRYSSPAVHDKKASTLAPGPHIARPFSLPPFDGEIPSPLLEQRIAELAQIRRMIITQEDLPVPEPPQPRPPIAQRASTISGLGIIHEELEVDIGSTPLSNFDYISFSTDHVPPQRLLSYIQQPQEEARLPTPRSSVSGSRPMSSIHSEPMSLDSLDSGSSMAETDVVEEDVGEVRMAHTHSVEIKKGVLVSLNSTISQFVVSSKRNSSSSYATIERNSVQQRGQSHKENQPKIQTRPSEDTFRRTITDFPSPPPMLSPITASSFTFLAEIEKGLGGGVFDYRNSSVPQRSTKENQLLALAEALKH